MNEMTQLLLELKKKKNVVSLGPGKKYVEGMDTGRDSIAVGVIKKEPEYRLTKRDIIPRRIRGIETDVWVVGRLALQNFRHDKWRPVPGGGVAVGHRDITYGTLTMVILKLGLLYGMSNNHVLANLNKGLIGDPIWQPGPYLVTPEMGDCVHGPLAEFVWLNKISLDPSDCQFSKGAAKFINFGPWLFHRKTRMMPMVEQNLTNLVDIALYKVPPDTPVHTILGNDGKIIKVTGSVEPVQGMKLEKYGARTDYTYGEVTSVGVSAVVALDQLGFEYAIFEEQGMTYPMSDGGDSGSGMLKMLNEEEAKIAGVLFAGSPQATLFNIYRNIIKELKPDPF